MFAFNCHIRDYDNNTNVMQVGGQITDVKTIGERVKWARNERGMTQAQLGKAAGVSTSTIGNLESGIRDKPRELNAIAAALRASPKWLESNRGDWQANSKNEGDDLKGDNFRGRESGEKIPLISPVAAGMWAEIIDNFQPGDAEYWLHCPVRHGPRTFALTVDGPSMYNPGAKLSFSEGDIIFVDPDVSAIHRSLVVVRLDDEKKATFKRLLIDGEKKYLEALNPSWPERIMSINGNATVCGVVIAKVQSLI